jgi:hypothetical protein
VRRLNSTHAKSGKRTRLLEPRTCDPKTARGSRARRHDERGSGGDRGGWSRAACGGTSTAPTCGGPNASAVKILKTLTQNVEQSAKQRTATEEIRRNNRTIRQGRGFLTAEEKGSAQPRSGVRRGADLGRPRGVSQRVWWRQCRAFVEADGPSRHQVTKGRRSSDGIGWFCSSPIRSAARDNASTELRVVDDEEGRR